MTLPVRVLVLHAESAVAVFGKIRLFDFIFSLIASPKITVLFTIFFREVLFVPNYLEMNYVELAHVEIRVFCHSI